MTNFRAFRNSDAPALADLWNRGIPDSATARPLTAHDFDSHIASRLDFDANGLIVAERDGRIVGYAHAGFGPDEPVGPPNQLNFALGTIAMLVVESGADDEELETQLVLAAERYLRRHGAEVIYAGGQAPLNPFYWGLYGGSEFAGILSTHKGFRRAVVRAGYEPVSETVLMEADLDQPEVREPRSPLIRRVARVEIIEDCLPDNWWEALAIGNYRPTCFQLLAKADDRVLAHATTWDMSWFSRHDSRLRLGLVAMGVDPEHRRKGYGRHLMAEILRRSRGEMVSCVALQTRATNTPALELYQSLGFVPSDTAYLYRLPAQLTARADS